MLPWMALMALPRQDVALTFPVLGAVTWTDTWGAPRGGGRTHIGQDLPAEKMRPLVAARDGVWYGSALNGSGIRCEDGVSLNYYHLNNDSPGTDDGLGGDEYAMAPGVWAGVPVRAGQFVAYLGDSGNAEETVSHLHFELWLKDVGVVNAFSALTSARRLECSEHYPERPEFVPLHADEIRWDGEVREVNPENGYVKIDLAGTVDSAGVALGISRFTRRYLKYSDCELVPKVGDFCLVIGKIPEVGKGMSPKAMLVLRNRYAP
jgi:murein DD-endopeptidase MepM/ murein hydrolase activator NlpD